MTRQQALDLRDKDPVFAADWANAVETAVDHLEDIATHRAKAENDKLLELLLKAKRPEVYARPEATKQIRRSPSTCRRSQNWTRNIRNPVLSRRLLRAILPLSAV